MTLGMKVGLGPGDFVLDVDPAPPRKKGTAPSHSIFVPCLLWPNGWMDEDATWYGIDLGKGHIVLDGDPAPPAKGAHQPPLFGPYLLGPQSPISATVELL